MITYIIVRVEKVGRKYITGVCNWFDPQLGEVVEKNQYSSKFDMTEYDIVSKSFDVLLVRRFREYQSALREYQHKENIAFRDIEWEERDKYRDVKGGREATWREANPRPVFGFSSLVPKCED